MKRELGSHLQLVRFDFDDPNKRPMRCFIGAPLAAARWDNSLYIDRVV
jgi:hypothetical protein